MNTPHRRFSCELTREAVRLLRCDKRIRYRVTSEHVGEYPIGMM